MMHPQSKAGEGVDESRRLRHIIDNVPHPVSFVSRDYRYLTVNRAYTEVYDAPREAIVGRTAADFCGRDVFEKQIRPRLDQCLAGETVRYQLQVELPGKGLRWMDMAYFPYKDEVGRVLGITVHGSDITDRIRTEESQWLHSLTLSQIEDRVTVTDLEGYITYVNDAECRMLGMAREDLIGRHISVYGEDAEQGATQDEIVRRTLEEGEWRGEVVNYRSDGSSVILDCRTHVVKDDRDRPIALCGISTDVTERKQAEKERETYLRELEFTNQAVSRLSRMENVEEICGYIAEKVRSANEGGVVVVSLYDAAQDAIRVKSIAGIEPFLEDLAGLFGEDPHAVSFSPEQMTGDTRLYTSGRLEHIPGGLHQIAEGRIPKAVCRELERKTGLEDVYTVGFALDEKPVGGITLFLPAGSEVRQVYAIEAIASNLSLLINRLQAEEALRESEQQKNLILNSTAEMVGYYDRDLRVIWVNRAFAEGAGEAPEAVVGRHCYEIWQRRSEPCEECPVTRARDTGTAQQGEMQTPDGRWWTLRAYPVLDGQGGVSALVEFGQDITERKRAEEESGRLQAQIHQAQKLESIGRLAGGVAHDLNNLLSPILGYGEMLLDAAGMDDPRRESLEEIMKAGRRARDLVRQLLAFSRKQLLEFKTIDVNTLLCNFERLLRRTIREDIAIHMNLAEALPFVEGDVGQLEQVVMNLAVNAQDAMPDGGDLTFETALVELDAEYAAQNEAARAGAHVMLKVRDTGCGMDESTRQQLFEPFFTTKEKDRGTGLGLATVYGIIKQHGGHLWVKSMENRGTSFTIYLPVSTRPSLEEALHAPRPAAGGGSETILLVEDDEQVKHLAHAVLQREGYEVVAAKNGKEALEVAEKHDGPIHLVLTDVVMPGMNGRELFERIAVRYPQARPLFMSGYTEDVIAHRGVIDEGVRFIQKPFSVKALSAKVRQALDQQT